MTTPEPFVPPVHFERSDGVLTCVHTIPVGPDSCRECRDLADVDEKPVATPAEEQCTCGRTACESDLCDCDEVPCPVDHAAEGPAHELRAAATKLRADVEAARRFVPEPWTITCEQVIRAANDDIVADRSSCRPGDDADLPYIAAMHPGVGLALADLLDDQADGDDEGVINPWALAVARALNGGAS